MLAFVLDLQTLDNGPHRERGVLTVSTFSPIICVSAASAGVC